MKIQPENTDDIVAIIASKFNCFGGGKNSTWGNPLAEALKNQPASFAAGVDVKAVVEAVIGLYEQIPKHYHAAK